MSGKKLSTLYYYGIGLLFLYLIWKAGAFLYGKDIILPHPERVLHEFLQLTTSSIFYKIIAGTVLRGLFAFSVAMIIGLIVGVLSFIFPKFSILIHPAMTLIRATPVVALILLALIWFPSNFVPVFSSILMSFPVISTSIQTGLTSIDKQLLEMTHVYHFLRLDKIRYLYIPALKPHLIAAMHNTLGLTWKVVIAGEILSQPVFAIGTEMNNARLMLETPRVFAWVLCGILLCAMSDAIFFIIFRNFTWNLQLKT